MEALNINWVDRSQKSLDQLRELRVKPDKDRLDELRCMRFGLMLIGQSLAGWMQWVNSPEVMATFSKDELQEMSNRILDMIEKFVEYDIEVTNEGMQKGFAKQKEMQQQEGNAFVI